MEIQALTIPCLKLVTPNRHRDDRGWFSESYNAAALRRLGISNEFIQDNTVFSRKAGTVRGYHFQAPPHAQAKLVRVIRGEIFDVALDLRAGSATYGKAVGVRLSAAAGNQLLVPVGFAHAYMTLSDDCEVYYKVSAPYRPDCEGGVRWNDPAIDIEWPRVPRIVISERDKSLPLLAALDTPFVRAAMAV